MLPLLAIEDVMPEAAALWGTSSRYVYPSPPGLGDVVVIHRPDDVYCHAAQAEVVAVHHRPGLCFDRWAVTVCLPSGALIVVPDYLVFKAKASQLPPTERTQSLRLEAVL